MIREMLNDAPEAIVTAMGLLAAVTCSFLFLVGVFG